LHKKGVIVRFGGICTHYHFPEPDGTWRVTLVNASQANIDASPLKDCKIMPHKAQLQLVKNEVTSIQGDVASFYQDPDSGDHLLRDLAGVTITIFNAAHGDTLVDHSGGIQVLADVAAGPAITTLDRSLASCHFDFKAGTIEPIRILNSLREPLSAKLTAATSEDPKLLITPFSGGGTTVVTLGNLSPDKNVATIDILHGPEEPESDTPNQRHFLLHYLAADHFPDDFRDLPLPPYPVPGNLLEKPPWCSPNAKIP